MCVFVCVCSSRQPLPCTWNGLSVRHRHRQGPGRGLLSRCRAQTRVLSSQKGQVGFQWGGEVRKCQPERVPGLGTEGTSAFMQSNGLISSRTSGWGRDLSMFVQLVGGRAVIGTQSPRSQTRSLYSPASGARPNCFRMAKSEATLPQSTVVLPVGHRVLSEIVCCLSSAIPVGDAPDSDGKTFHRNEDSKSINGLWIKTTDFY